MRIRVSGHLLGMLCVVVLLCLPLLINREESNYTWDETNYYLPAIAQMRANWPALDLTRDSLSATAPGYPYLLATFSHLVGPGLINLRLLNLTVSLCLLTLLWQAWRADAPESLLLAALAPLACSNFFIKSSAYVVTDNASLLAASGTLMLALATPAWRSFRWGCATGAISVFIRQSTFWLEAPLALRAFSVGRFREGVFLLLPAAVLLGLVAAWGGLVPPAWQSSFSTGICFAAGAYHLSVLAILGPFYLLALRVDWRAAARSTWALAGAAGGCVVAFGGPNTFAPDDGRWGGYLWGVAARLPALGPYSPLFLLLAPLGGFVLGLLMRQIWCGVPRDRALIWLAAQTGFLLASLANRLVFHRYFEPTQLVLLVLWLSLVAPAAQGAGRPRRGPLLLLAAGQLLVTLVTAHGRTYGLLPG